MKGHLKKYGAVGLTCFAVYLAIRYWQNIEGLAAGLMSAAWPLVIGCAAAYVVNILMSFYENKLLRGVKKGRRAIAAALSYISLVLMIVLLFNMVLPELWACLQLLGQRLPGMMERAADALGKYVDIDSGSVEEAIAYIESIDLRTISEKLLHGVGGALSAAATVVGSVVSFVVTAVVALFFSAYILLNKERVCGAVSKLAGTYLPERAAQKLGYIVWVLDQCFHRFIVGQCIEAVILGSLCAIGMLILRLPYAAMIGTLVGFTALIPVAGAYIGAVVGVLMIASESWIKAVIFVVFLILLQQFEGNVIYPRVVGSSIGLPGMLVLAAITVGGGVGGIFGMLISVPLTASAYRLVTDDLERRKKGRSAPCGKEERTAEEPPVPAEARPERPERKKKKSKK